MKNKKLNVVIALIAIVIACTSCSVQKPVDEIDAVAKKPVERNLEYISLEGTNYFSSEDAQQLYDTSDYVIVGTPIDSFEESEQYWRAGYTPVDFESADMIYSCSSQRFKVNKVYKGEDSNIKEIIVCTHAITDGKIVKICDGSYIIEKDQKYLLFLKESNSPEFKEKYFAERYQGTYDLESSNNDNNPNIYKEMLKEVKEIYKDDFKD